MVRGVKQSMLYRRGKACQQQASADQHLPPNRISIALQVIRKIKVGISGRFDEILALSTLLKSWQCDLNKSCERQ